MRSSKNPEDPLALEEAVDEGASRRRVVRAVGRRPRSAAGRCSDDGRRGALLGAQVDDGRRGTCCRSCLTRISSDDVCEFNAGQYSKGFAANYKFDDAFLHFGTIAQISRSLHAAITRSGLGNVHRETSPPNPRVTMSSPSKWIPIT